MRVDPASPFEPGSSPSVRFAELVRRPQFTLDEAVLLIAAHARPGLDVAAYQSRLDDLARACAEPVLAEVSSQLFGVAGFRGNDDDYYDPRNSYLDAVLDRRLGIPISLGVVLIEVARRLDISLSGVNLPGHFLVRLDGEPAILLDPFNGGRILGLSECEERFRAAHPDAPFDPAYLEPVDNHAIVGRILANLRQIHLVRNDSVALEWVLRLRGLLPGSSIEDRSERAGVLVALAQFDEAATVLEDLASQAPDARAASLAAKAKRLRARLN
jgi:regulator of sirC expression with transglutaminase-like and TPR domain